MEQNQGNEKKMEGQAEPLTGAQALHAAAVMARLNEEAMDLLLVTNLEVASHEYDNSPDEMLDQNHDKLEAARQALVTRFASLRAVTPAQVETMVEAADTASKVLRRTRTDLLDKSNRLGRAEWLIRKFESAALDYHIEGLEAGAYEQARYHLFMSLAIHAAEAQGGAKV